MRLRADRRRVRETVQHVVRECVSQRNLVGDQSDIARTDVVERARLCGDRDSSVAFGQIRHRVVIVGQVDTPAGIDHSDQIRFGHAWDVGEVGVERGEDVGADVHAIVVEHLVGIPRRSRFGRDNDLGISGMVGIGSRNAKIDIADLQLLIVRRVDQVGQYLTRRLSKIDHGG